MDALIELKEISKQINGRRILNSVTLGVGHGEIFALVGPNGAGKTTTLRVMLGLFASDKGSVRILGMNPRLEGRKIRQKVGVVLERHGLYSDLTVEDNLNFYAKIYGIERAASRIDEVLNFINLNDRRKDMVGRLSKGMKQKLAIARALLSNPSVLFLDEPTSGIDPVFQTEIRQRLLKLSHEGKTIFINSHNLSEVEDICSRIAIMNQGSCLVEDSVDRILDMFSGRKFAVGVSDGLGLREASKILAPFGHIQHHKQKSKLEIICRDQIAASSFLSMVSDKGSKFTTATALPVDLYDVFNFYQKGEADGQ